jgi:hypothetical protein
MQVAAACAAPALDAIGCGRRGGPLGAAGGCAAIAGADCVHCGGGADAVEGVDAVEGGGETVCTGEDVTVRVTGADCGGLLL